MLIAGVAHGSRHCEMPGNAPGGLPHILCIGGEDHHLRLPFLRRLRNSGYRVTAAGTGDAGPFREAGIAYHGFRFDRFVNPLADRDTIRTLRTIIASVKPAIVQSFDTKPNVLVPLAARAVPGTRVVRTINGLGWVYSSRSPLALALRPVQLLLHRLASASVHATVFQNRDDLAFFRRHNLVGSGPGHLIAGSGVDIDAFTRMSSEDPAVCALREALVPGCSEVVITVTRLTRQKGIPALLKAAALVHRQRPGVRFLLVGPRETEGRLAISQRELDRHAPYVTALGHRSDVPALLQLASVFAFPTEYREGVPRVLLEAALAGLPIVSTAMPGCNDVIHDRSTGRLVPPRSPRAMAAAILDLLRDRPAALEMGMCAREQVIRGFGLPLTVSHYCALYAMLLAHEPLAAARRAGMVAAQTADAAEV